MTRQLVTTGLCVALAGLLAAGCGTMGSLDKNVMCQGKVIVMGSASGFAGINGTVDCGEGFQLYVGKPGAPSPSP